MWTEGPFHPRAVLRLLSLACVAVTAFAAAHRGQVAFNGLPVPGAVVTTVRDGRKLTAITDGISASPSMMPISPTTGACAPDSP